MRFRVNALSLNVRSRPSLRGVIVHRVRAGDLLEHLDNRTEEEDGIVWHAVYDPRDHTIGWCAAPYLTVIRDTGAPRGSKIGFHIAGGHVPDSLEQILRDLYNSSKPLACALVVNHGHLCRAIKEASPTTVVVYRPVLWDDSDNPASRGWMCGRDWFNRLWGHMHPYRQWVDYFQFENEWFVLPSRTEAEMRRFGQFFIELMETCENAGVRCLVGNIAVGNLDPHHEPALHEMFLRAERAGHPFDYHMYSSQHRNHDMLHEADLYAARWHRWARKYPNLKFIFGEAGSFHGPRYVDPQTTIAQMRQTEQLIQPFDSQVIGACWWTLAGEPGGWGADDFAPALPQVAQYLKSR
jgi:hypothetical protein